MAHGFGAVKDFVPYEHAFNAANAAARDWFVLTRAWAPLRPPPVLSKKKRLALDMHGFQHGSTLKANKKERQALFFQ